MCGHELNIIRGAIGSGLSIGVFDGDIRIHNIAAIGKDRGFAKCDDFGKRRGVIDQVFNFKFTFVAFECGIDIAHNQVSRHGHAQEIIMVGCDDGIFFFYFDRDIARAGILNKETNDLSCAGRDRA